MKKLCIFLENFEMGGVTTHLETLLQNKNFSYKEIFIFSNNDNKAFNYIKKKLNKKNIFFVKYNNLNSIKFKNIFSKIFYHSIRPLLFIISIFYFFQKFKKFQNSIFLFNCGGYGNFRSEMAAIISVYLLGNRSIYLLIHHCFTKPIIWNFLLQFINYFIFKYVKKIIFVSNATRKNILKNVYFFRKHKNISIVYNGIKNSNLKSYYNPYFFKYRDFIKIGIVSRIEKFKGHSELIESIKKIDKKTIDKTKFFFIGSGKKIYIQSLKKKIREYKLDKFFIFTGYIPGDSRELMANLDLVLSLNQKFEGFGYSHVEAASIGKPVFATDVGAAKEIFGKKSSILLTTGDNCLLKSKLEGFIKNKFFYVKKAKTLKDKINKKFNENLMVKKFNQILVHND